jgi:hypothetical protein
MPAGSGLEVHPTSGSITFGQPVTFAVKAATAPLGEITIHIAGTASETSITVTVVAPGGG